jgi:hypothetical protein
MEDKDPTITHHLVEGDSQIESVSAKREPFGFGFYMLLGILLTVFSLSGPAGPLVGNALIHLVIAFCGLQSYLRWGNGLQRISSLLLFAGGLGLFLAPILATAYAEWIRR